MNGQCVCNVIQEDGRARYLRFLVVPFQEEPLLGLGACEHLELVNSVAAVCEESRSEEPLLEGANVRDSDKIQSDPLQSSSETCLRDWVVCSHVPIPFVSRMTPAHMRLLHLVGYHYLIMRK